MQKNGTGPLYHTQKSTETVLKTQDLKLQHSQRKTGKELYKIGLSNGFLDLTLKVLATKAKTQVILYQTKKLPSKRKKSVKWPCGMWKIDANHGPW